jgi:hypothetical protein
MTRSRALILFTFVLLAGVISYLAATSIVFRNLPLVIAYEKTLDTYAQTDTTVADVTTRADAHGREAGLVSAFFGLDDGLPHMFGLVACRGAGGMDGMPVIFSHEVDIRTLEPGDFAITTASGKVGKVVCLTLAPADDPGELRTALVIGEYGSAADQPVLVKIVGNVLSKDGTVNFRGASVRVTPLESGPSLVWAEPVPRAEWALDRAATRLPWGGGNGCSTGTAQVVRVAWDGGVKKRDGSEADAAIGRLYEVTVIGPDGGSRVVTPMALADLGDGDNNHSLCLDVADPALSVRFPGGQLTDPRDDLNDDTMIGVTRADKNG